MLQITNSTYRKICRCPSGSFFNTRRELRSAAFRHYHAANLCCLRCSEQCSKIPRVHYLIKYQHTVYWALYKFRQGSVLKRAHLSGNPLVGSLVCEGVKESCGLVLNGYVKLSRILNDALRFLQSESINRLNGFWLCLEVLVERAESVYDTRFTV